MGREETMASTRYVPAHVCWACYAVSLAFIYASFTQPQPVSSSPYWNGLFAHAGATCVIWCFSWRYSNTSLYDPAWCVFPIAIALGFMSQADAAFSSPSPRAVYSLLLLVVWYARYHTFFPWEGWTDGIHTEDWRYVDIADKTGSGTLLYWLASLTSLHLTPTLLVWFALAPARAAWLTPSSAAPPLSVLDAAALAVAGGAIVLQGFADDQLRRFRATQYAKGTNLNVAKGAKGILRTGCWAWSRHPNYFGEALFWCGMALVGAAANDGVGPARTAAQTWGGGILMMLFFRLSAYITDQRMLKHRGDKYVATMAEINGLVPLPFKVPLL